MGSINKAVIVGHAGSDPEVRMTASGAMVANFNVATNDGAKDASGAEKTEWHRIVAFGRQAEFCRDYLRKGRLVGVDGRIQYRDWTDRDGNKRNTTEIVAHSVQFLGSHDAVAAAKVAPAVLATATVSAGAPPEAPIAEDDIPF
ncbi:MAG: Single-stranded DNA-binding protein [Parcubacteria group bacterium GW2011_GWB1_56_8]|nr:MAG: Single-stranded DNA-binding protein [Parcubacteria group bacterium GW2011_GWB1_56_8]